jgi:hypothetical protein
MVSRLQKTRVLGVEILFHLPSCLFFRMMTPLYLVHPYSLSLGLPFIFVQHPHGMLDEREIRLNPSICFRDHFSSGTGTPFFNWVT